MLSILLCRLIDDALMKWSKNGPKRRKNGTFLTFWVKTRANLSRHGQTSKDTGKILAVSFQRFRIFKDTDIELKTRPCNILFARVLACLIKCIFRKQDTVLEPKTRPCNYIFVRVLPVSGPNASKWWNDEVLTQDTVWKHKTRPCNVLIGPCLTRTHHFGLFKLGMNPRLREPPF